MANNNIETKYIKWNTFIAIAAIVTSTFVSMYTINKQNDFWEHQNAIKNKEQYNQIRLKKIEDIDKAFNQFIILYERKAIIRNSILPEIKGITSAGGNMIGDLMGRLITDAEMIDELRINIMSHLETLTPFFSDDIVNDAKELSKMICDFEFLDSEVKEWIDKSKTGMSQAEKADFAKELKMGKDMGAIFLKFNSLIEKMYLQVKSELDANQIHPRPFWHWLKQEEH